MSMMANPYRLGAAAPVTDPNWANVVYLSGFGGADASTSFTDDSTYARAMTRSGAAQVDTGQSKFGGSSLLLDGNGDWLQSTTVTDLNFGTGEFTVEAFIRFNTTQSGAIVALWAALAGGTVWRLIYTVGTGLVFRFRNTSSAYVDTTGAWTPSTGIWYHVACDRDGAGKIRLYVDGVMIGSATSAADMNIGAPTFYVGSSSAGSYFDGWLDEVRVTKSVARYASDGGFVVPTAAFPRS